eukprot:gene4826-6761_t
MGRLVQLEVENFKSYAGKHLVGPFVNFTCIVGPNGSGKSNMMDAISFVLGVQSKHLRSNQLKSLLYRKNIDSTPAKKASVKLVYETSNQEIEGYDDGSEIEFMRSISSAGVSTYRIDNRECTYEKYESILQQIGVLVKTRNFLVFQGDIESVASKSPQDLTKLIEQISGSEQYAEEYSELLRKRESSEENTLFAMQKRKIFATQCKEVKSQKEEAEFYQSKQNEMNDLKTESVLFQLFRILSEKDDHQKIVDKIKSELAAVKGLESELEDDMLTEKKDLAKISKQLATAEKERAVKAKQLDQLSPKLAEIRAKIKSVQKRIVDLTKNEATTQSNLSQQQQTINDLTNDIEELQSTEIELKEKLESAKEDSGMKMSHERMQEYTRLREQVAARTTADHSNSLTLESDVKSKQQQLQRMENQIESLQREMVAGDKMVEEYTERIQKLQGGVQSLNRERDGLIEKRDKTGDEMRDGSAELSQITIELEAVSEKLRNVGDDRRRSKHEEKMNEALETMQRIYKGVYGKLVDLCRPIQKKYSVAVATAAGKQMDAIVVDSKATATECIRYLKDQRVGTCLFLPLDNLSIKPIPERLRALVGNNNSYRMCTDLIECEERFKSAVSYAVGSTLVCDTLEEAQDLCFNKNERVTVVTLRGHTINKSGAMTGGYSAGNQSGHQDRWEEKDVQKLRQTKQNLEDKLHSLNQKLPTRQTMIDIQTQTKTIETKIQFTEADLIVCREKLEGLNKQKWARDGTMDKCIFEMNALKADIQTVQNKLNTLQSKTREIENDIFASFSTEIGIENIREVEGNYQKNHEDLLAKCNAVAKQISSLSASLDYEKKRNFIGKVLLAYHVSETTTDLFDCAYSS